LILLYLIMYNKKSTYKLYKFEIKNSYYDKLNDRWVYFDKNKK